MSITGRVQRPAGENAEPIAGSWVVLHQMTPSAAGVLDSVRSDRAGAYRFRVTPDSASQLVVGVEYAGIAYLSDMIIPGSASTMALDPILVYDTSSMAPVEVAQRHILMQPALPDGSRPVVELLVLRNIGDHTLVGRDSTSPAWETVLPAGALDVVAGENDVGHEAIHAHGDTLELLAPVPPGEKQLVVTYLLPASRRFSLSIDQPVAALGIMVADTTATVEAGPVSPAGVTTFEGARYLRLDGTNLPAGDRVVLQLAPQPLAAGDFWWVVIALAAAVLAGGFIFGMRRTAGRSGAEALAAQIAAMDRDPATAADPEWPERRRQLLATLAATLAKEKGGS